MDINRMLKMAGLPEQPAQVELVESHEGAEEAQVEVLAEADKVETGDDTPELDNKKENAGKVVKVPADVTKAIEQRVKELKAALDQFKEKQGVKPNAIEALEKIARELKHEGGLEAANLFYGTLMSPITDLFPPKLVKFLHSKPEEKTVKEGLTREFYIYSIFPKDGSKIYLSTMDGERAVWTAKEVNRQLSILNTGETEWFSEPVEANETQPTGDELIDDGGEQAPDVDNKL